MYNKNTMLFLVIPTVLCFTGIRLDTYTDPRCTDRQHNFQFFVPNRCARIQIPFPNMYTKILYNDTHMFFSENSDNKCTKEEKRYPIPLNTCWSGNIYSITEFPFNATYAYRYMYDAGQSGLCTKENLAYIVVFPLHTCISYRAMDESRYIVCKDDAYIDHIFNDAYCIDLDGVYNMTTTCSQFTDNIYETVTCKILNS